MTPLDDVRLNFDAGALVVLNVVLGLVMFGIALDLKVSDFKRVAAAPTGPLVGMFAQFLLLPAATFAIIQVVQPAPSIALGMLMVASCPGGNVSNFLAHMAKGNTALSISMTACSTAASVIMTPLNLGLWGQLDPGTAALLKSVDMNPLSMLGTIGLLLGLPLVLGMVLAHKRPRLAARISKPLKIFSMLAFALFIVGALVKNWQHFMDYVTAVMAVVALMNAAALALGYWSARGIGLPKRDARALSIEVGIQNSGLGLTLIFANFEGLGGMAIVAAWWGIWHIIAGGTLAMLWARQPLPDGELQCQPDASL